MPGSGNPLGISMVSRDTNEWVKPPVSGLSTIIHWKDGYE